ncbi:MAG: radical SAM protein [Coriobacteriales bacterium]|nr:radical SAM protein [Coriobacteriales bacterium]
MAGLVDGLYLVPEGYDEMGMVDNLRVFIRKLRAAKGVNYYTIFTTTDCNAHCFYCFQSVLSRASMSASTASRIVEYMVEHKGEGPLRLIWFGGEPLVGVSRIDQICRELSERGVEYLSAMMSNGYLFDEEMVRRAVDVWHLKSIQIPLDGTEDVYNTAKAYTSHSGSPYRRVRNNIALLVNAGVHVNILLNLDQHNEDDLEELVGDLADEFVGRSNVSVNVHVLFEDKGFAPLARDEDVRERLYRHQASLNERIFEKGLSVAYRSLPHLECYCCKADRSDSTVIYPDGSLYKCEHVADGDAYGSIFDGVTDASKISKFETTMSWDRCATCPLYPQCYILKECDEVCDVNEIVCDYHVRMRTLAVADYYEKKVKH